MELHSGAPNPTPTHFREGRGERGRGRGEGGRLYLHMCTGAILARCRKLLLGVPRPVQTDPVPQPPPQGSLIWEVYVCVSPTLYLLAYYSSQNGSWPKQLLSRILL
jgi:hypothetical protein